MGTTINNTPGTKIKPCTTKELAGMYGVSTKTLRTWLLPHLEYIGKRISKYYTAKQVRVIFDRLGEPG